VELSGALIRKSNRSGGQFAVELLQSILEQIMPKQLIHTDRTPASAGAYHKDCAKEK
jgi:hypothetical protein